MGKVKGQLLVSEDEIHFYPIVCSENKSLDLSSFKFTLDYRDVTAFHELQLYNETGQYVKVVERKNYMYDFYLEIDVS